MKRVVISILFLIGSIRAMDVCEVPHLDTLFVMKFREVILCEFDHHDSCKEVQSAFAQYKASLCGCPKTTARYMICHTDPKKVLLNSNIVAELKRTHDLDLWEKDPSKFEMIITHS